MAKDAVFTSMSVIGLSTIFAFYAVEWLKSMFFLEKKQFFVFWLEEAWLPRLQEKHPPPPLSTLHEERMI